MSRSRRARSKDWLARQNKDVFVKQARQQGYRSRAVHKLQAIDQQERLLRPGQRVLDLGAAPGSWSQYAREKVGDTGLVVAVDRLEFDAVPGVQSVLGDITEPQTVSAISQLLPSGGADLVISDMAPNISGIKASDEARFSDIFQIVDVLCDDLLRTGGNLLVKVFEGEAAIEWQKGLRGRFNRITKRKPAASRDRSREYYVVAREFKGAHPRKPM